jgi:tetratricopeptide (TPR) repeat protein
VDPSAALAAAVDAGLLELDCDRVRFAHPLIASVVYADADAAERRALHARIADVVAEPEERARHLALATDAPDDDVAASLDEAARSVRARGAPGEAAELYEEARRLTPSLQINDAARRAVDAAECHFEGGDFARVRALLEEVTAGHSTERARALVFLAWVRANQEGFGVGADIFRAALEAVGPDIPLRIEIERGLAWTLHELGDLQAAEIHSRAALELAERLREPSVLARALSDMAFFEAVTGRGDPLSRIESALQLDEPGEWRVIYDRPDPRDDPPYGAASSTRPERVLTRCTGRPSTTGTSTRSFIPSISPRSRCCGGGSSRRAPTPSARTKGRSRPDRRTSSRSR